MTPLITFHHILKTLNYIQKIKCFVQVGSHDGVMHDPLREFILKNCTSSNDMVQIYLNLK